MTRQAPVGRNATPEIAELAAISDRLFAEHAALAAKLRERDAEREVERRAALSRQKATDEAEQAAWSALEKAEQDLRDNPGDAQRAAALAAAESSYKAALAEARTAGQEVHAVMKRQLDEIVADSPALHELGQRARAAQDRLIEAEMAETRARNATQATLDPYGEDIARRCKLALEHHGGHPSAAWSTGEQLAVAFVLRDKVHLDAMGYTPTDAASRILGDTGISPDQLTAWVNAVRAAAGLTSTV